MSDLAYPLHMFRGKFSEANEMMERTWNNMLYSLQKEGLRQHFTPQEMQLALARTWNNMLYSLQKEGLRQHFTPQEMQLALADLQVHFTYAVMDYAMYHEDAVRKYEQRDGRYQMVILDSLEWNEIYKTESYKQAKVQRVAG